jgi:hypothetical protein
MERVAQMFCRATASGCQHLERQAMRLPYNSVIPSEARNLSFDEENHTKSYCLLPSPFFSSTYSFWGAKIPIVRSLTVFAARDDKHRSTQSMLV